MSEIMKSEEKKVAVEENVKQEEKEKKKFDYTFRELCDEDIFPLTEILGKVLPDEATKTIVNSFVGKDGNEDKDVEENVEVKGGIIAINIGKLIMRNIKTVKDDVYVFLSDLTGIPVDELRKAPFGTTPKMLKELFEDAKNEDFFKELFKSIS